MVLTMCYPCQAYCAQQVPRRAHGFIIKTNKNEVLRQYSWGCYIVDKADPLSEEEEEEEDEEEEEAEAEATRCQIKNCKENQCRGTKCRDTKS